MPPLEVHFADDHAAQLLKGRAEELANPAACGWELVKQNASRSVYRGSIGASALYLKQFHSKSIWKRLAQRLGISDAKREFELSRLLQSNGVKASVVLAAAWGPAGGWVLTEEVSDAEEADSLHAKLLNSGDEAGIAKASRAIARLVARMHSAGVTHRDMHCGNVMMRRTGGRLEPVLMDLHRAAGRCRRMPSRRARAMNLAQLCHDRMRFTTRTQRLRFLRNYLKFSGARGSLGGWEMLVSFFLQRWVKRHWAHRDRRVRGKNRYFTPLKLAGGWKGSAIRATKGHLCDSPASRVAFTAEQWREVLADPQALLEGDGVLVVKDSPSGRVVKRRLDIAGQTLEVFVKLARPRGLVKMLVDCCRPSRALRGFRLGHMLITRGFATPLPLAAIECRTGPVLRKSILITESSDASWICDYLQETLADRACIGRAHRTLWRTGRMLKHLHAAGFAHRDLKATNLLIAERPSGRDEPVIVDLDGLSQPGILTVNRRIANLGRLELGLVQLPLVTHACQLRVLLGYLLGPGACRSGYKVYWRVIESALAWKVKQLREGCKHSWTPGGDPRRQWS